MLTNAAIYIVAFEVLPKSSEDTAITMIHIISFIFSLATLAVSVVSVSLYSVKTSTGVMSEQELLMAFVRADGDHSGSLDKDEIEQAVAKLGLPPVVNERLRAALDEVDAAITLPIWYDMVGELYKTVAAGGELDRKAIGRQVAESADLVYYLGDALEAAKNAGVFLDEARVFFFDARRGRCAGSRPGCSTSRLGLH